jgi:predicted MFS family arabinose efflux permease
MPSPHAPTLTPERDVLAAPGWITLLLAASCGLVVANLYYAQPLIGPIGAALGLPPGLAGLIVTLTQVGYGLGLLFIVPLADIVDNRRLVVVLLGVCAAALLGEAFMAHAVPFLAGALLIGISAVAVQVLVPYAAHLVPEAQRGRTVGNVMSGLMLGIMLARPAAGLVAGLWSWHAVFVLSALVTALVAALLAWKLPPYRPVRGLGYGGLLRSMGYLLLGTPVLVRRAFYQAGLFGAFSLFWTTVPLHLAGPAFGLSSAGIALFALVGVTGAIAAPIAGRLADRGWSRPMTGIAILVSAASFLLMHLGHDGSHTALVLLALGAVLLDFGVSANLVLGQRAIFSLGEGVRGRLNGLFMAIFFVGGAAGSAAGAWAYAAGGWSLAAWVGFALPAAALLYFMTERVDR